MLIPPDEFFTYRTTYHMHNPEFKQYNNFEYLTDLSQINPDRYDYLFIVLALLDYDQVSRPENTYCIRMLNRICEQLTEKFKFKKVVVFDVYDYDYDPVKLDLRLKADLYFKRNYNKNKIYSEIVKPLPYLMFVRPCVMTILFKTQRIITMDKLNQAVWCGALYNHNASSYGVNRNRLEMYNQIKDQIVTLTNLPYHSYLESIRKYKIVVDLCGVGDPNKRTFEILAEGSLLLTNITDLEWGFENGDKFMDDTIFHDGVDFKIKLYSLLNYTDHYKNFLDKQNYLFTKYMNPDWISTYIMKKINYIS
jgi:hypothetical protein